MLLLVSVTTALEVEVAVDVDDEVLVVAASDVIATEDAGGVSTLTRRLCCSGD